MWGVRYITPLSRGCIMTNKDSQKSNMSRYKVEECKVLKYDQKFKTLDILFKSYGIRINDAENPNSDFVKIKYRGEIGKPNFVYML